jgi:hypothetical protein
MRDGQEGTFLGFGVCVAWQNLFFLSEREGRGADAEGWIGKGRRDCDWMRGT